jgi:enoyl-CoA hydratase
VYYTITDHGIEICLNRPDKKNAMDRSMSEHFPRLLEEVAVLPQSLVFLRGAGGVFSAGGDLGFLLDRLDKSFEENRTTMMLYYTAFLGVRELPQITVACLEDSAIGAALCMALACDFRLVEENCRLALNFVRLGISPGMGAVPLAVAILGPQMARKMLLGGNRVAADEFVRAGGGELVPPKTMQDSIVEFYAKFQDLGPLAVAKTKQELCRVGPGTEELYKCLELESQSQAHCFRDPWFRKKMQSIQKGKE